MSELAVFEREDLDVRVHQTTQEAPLERFAQEREHLTALPEQRFVGSLAEARKVNWDCLVSFRGNRYSVLAAYAAKIVWLQVSRGSTLVIVSGKREVVGQHAPAALLGRHPLRLGAVGLPGAASRPRGLGLRLALRERRRLALPAPPRSLQLRFDLGQPRLQAFQLLALLCTPWTLARWLAITAARLARLPCLRAPRDRVHQPKPHRLRQPAAH